jgi:hypothetical protein
MQKHGVKDKLPTTTYALFNLYDQSINHSSTPKGILKISI